MESMIIIQQDIEENDLTYWEFINNSDIASSHDNTASIDTLSLDSLPSWHSSLSSSPTTTTNTTKTPTNNNQNLLQDLTHHHQQQQQQHGHGDHDLGLVAGFPYFAEQVKYDFVVDDVDVDEEEEEEEENDDDDDDELDDELVPWHLSGKLGRNRMRKLGKRASSKITSAKRNPYRYVKPGCVHGKHGLGLKGSY